MAVGVGDPVHNRTLEERDKREGGVWGLPGIANVDAKAEHDKAHGRLDWGGPDDGAVGKRISGHVEASRQGAKQKGIPAKGTRRAKTVLARMARNSIAAETEKYAGKQEPRTSSHRQTGWMESSSWMDLIVQHTAGWNDT